MTDTQTLPALDTDAVRRIMRQQDPDDRDVFGWTIHRHIEDPGHVLINCDTTGNWLPGQAMRQAVARQLHRYADALGEAGFGTAFWRFKGWPSVLIVTADQDGADAIAPGICAELDRLNPGD